MNYKNLTESQLRRKINEIELEIMKKRLGIVYDREDGLYYYNSGTGEFLPIGKDSILLTIQIKGDDYFIANYSNGQRNESYRHTGQMQAIVDMTALICGYQPPRGLRHRDIPSGQTQSEGASPHEA